MGVEVKQNLNMIGYNYINGAFVSSESDDYFDNIDPCTEQSLGEFPNSTHTEIDQVYESARNAFSEWLRNHAGTMLE